MSFIVIPLTALLASILTFFSGFGLGTILLPVFSIYFNPAIAVGLTAIVHFSNNIFKIGLVYRHIDWKIVLKFGVPSLLAAIFGAFILTFISGHIIELALYQIGSHTFSITLFNLIIGSLIIIFSLFEVVPVLKQMSFNQNKLIFGGGLSGFFGGLSGHQGALRSAFLVQLNLPKESFIATGTAIACIVDIARMAVYIFTFQLVNVTNHISIIVAAVFAAIIGAVIGNQLLKKSTLNGIKWTVTLLMLTIAILMIFGILN